MHIDVTVSSPSSTGSRRRRISPWLARCWSLCESRSRSAQRETPAGLGSGVRTSCPVVAVCGQGALDGDATTLRRAAGDSVGPWIARRGVGLDQG
jgi:hypothetical protein